MSVYKNGIRFLMFSSLCFAFLGNSYAYDSMASCTENVTIKIGDIELSIPRDKDLMWIDIKGHRFVFTDEKHPFKNCLVENIENVWAMEWKGLGLESILEDDLDTEFDESSVRTTYQNHKRIIKNKMKDETLGQVETLEYGIKKISRETSSIYIMPTELLETGNDEPVVFYCTGPKSDKLDSGRCDVSYVHPDGIRFSYVVLRKDYSEDSYLALDLGWRQFYENIKSHVNE